MSKCAFLGLGVMGYPMAGHLLSGGHEVVVWNRTASKSQDWLRDYPAGSVAATPGEAAADAEFVFLILGDDASVRSVVYDHEQAGVLNAMGPGSILIDHTTASAGLAIELAEAATAKGCGFIDAPVSGGEAGAQNGVLTVMCGGDPAHFATAKPVIDNYARATTLLGPPSSGQLTKMVNQITIAGLLQGLSEAINFGAKVGLDMDLVVDVISKGAAGSWQLENRGKTMAADEFEFGFAVEHMRKDLGIAIAEAHRQDADVTIAELVDGY
ncbi:MAG: NAD(P)-dependent oxidoreductase, partial [Acidimicrobiales bacterium]